MKTDCMMHTNQCTPIPAHPPLRPLACAGTTSIPISPPASPPYPVLSTSYSLFFQH
ncbi:hypothetical protein BP00DRAFT_429852 [Aspergillus indologenus CBS 114.80]|uniref:Uncharacterized protein n=1 Tax=Aspergillus indologenus CBS 114.80 TaxID=1450541 RepID=A0A2V5HR00_9EURO|nr:hypothetical protein BP00DRAFT_429852 [Aspergillus indologenus CBS 114.80]